MSGDDLYKRFIEEGLNEAYKCVHCGFCYPHAPPTGLRGTRQIARGVGYTLSRHCLRVGYSPQRLYLSTLMHV